MEFQPKSKLFFLPALLSSASRRTSHLPFQPLPTSTVCEARPFQLRRTVACESLSFLLPFPSLHSFHPKSNREKRTKFTEHRSESAQTTDRARNLSPFRTSQTARRWTERSPSTKANWLGSTVVDRFQVTRQSQITSSHLPRRDLIPQQTCPASSSASKPRSSSSGSSSATRAAATGAPPLCPTPSTSTASTCTRRRPRQAPPRPTPRRRQLPPLPRKKQRRHHHHNLQRWRTGRCGASPPCRASGRSPRPVAGARRRTGGGAELAWVRSGRRMAREELEEDKAF